MFRSLSIISFLLLPTTQIIASMPQGQDPNDNGSHRKAVSAVQPKQNKNRTLPPAAASQEDLIQLVTAENARLTKLVSVLDRSKSHLKSLEELSTQEKEAALSHAANSAELVEIFKERIRKQEETERAQTKIIAELEGEKVRNLGLMKTLLAELTDSNASVKTLLTERDQLSQALEAQSESEKTIAQLMRKNSILEGVLQQQKEHLMRAEEQSIEIQTQCEGAFARVRELEAKLAEEKARNKILENDNMDLEAHNALQQVKIGTALFAADKLPKVNQQLASVKVLNARQQYDMHTLACNNDLLARQVVSYAHQNAAMAQQYQAALNPTFNFLRANGDTQPMKLEEMVRFIAHVFAEDKFEYLQAEPAQAHTPDDEAQGQ